MKMRELVHDFKNVLASIKVMNEVMTKLYQEGKTKEAEKYSDKIDEKVNLLTKMIDTLTK